jgi:hypothetical protein
VRKPATAASPIATEGASRMFRTAPACTPDRDGPGV